MTRVNDAAASGFTRGAADYERSRPSYPSEVLEALPLHRGAVVVDVAAGTGKLTRQLTASDAIVVGVEPVAAMRAVLAQHAPAVAGTAENLPLRDASVDAVTVAQAFHWFDAPSGLAEIHRVLKPGGTLLMVWNDRDNRVPWVAEMTAVIHAHDPGAYAMVTDWAAVVAETGLFTRLERRDLDNPQRDVDADTVVGRATSTSYVSAAGEAVRDQVARDVRVIVAGLGDRFDFPYVTELYTCRRA